VLLTAGCATRGAPATLTDEPTASRSPVSTSAVASLEGARRVAVGWVASTGRLLVMGPIGRREFLVDHVAPDSVAEMAAAVDADVDRLGAGLPLPVSELRLVETPLTATARLDGDGRAVVEVWSAVHFGAPALGAGRVVWRTTTVTLAAAVDGGWMVAGLDSREGPTPLPGDDLPGEWVEFAQVSGWPPAVEAVR
jgi:hypothetical protein